MAPPNFELIADAPSSSLLPTERRLLRPFPVQALETIRTHMLQAGTSSVSPGVQARSLLALAYSTELRGIFEGVIPTTTAFSTPLLAPSRDTLNVALPSRVAPTVVDARVAVALAPYREPALGALRGYGVPEQYVGILRDHLNSSDLTHRAAAYAGVALLAAVMLHRK